MFYILTKTRSLYLNLLNKFKMFDVFMLIRTFLCVSSNFLIKIKYKLGGLSYQLIGQLQVKSITICIPVKI